MSLTIQSRLLTIYIVPVFLYVLVVDILPLAWFLYTQVFALDGFLSKSYNGIFSLFIYKGMTLSHLYKTSSAVNPSVNIAISI